MKIGAIIDMFKRSQNKNDVKYINYIGDSDFRTYIDINFALYDDDTLIIKKEGIEHVQKRIGHRLRECKMKEFGEKLTGKMIDKLIVYYGLANSKIVTQ